jgi:hypothetical protein
VRLTIQRGDNEVAEVGVGGASFPRGPSMSVAVLKHGAEEGEVRDRPNLVERPSKVGLTGDWDRWRCRCTIWSETTGSDAREQRHNSGKSRGGDGLLQRASAYVRKGGKRWVRR